MDRSIPGPVGASALDSPVREPSALVLGGRLDRGPRGHGLVVRELKTRVAVTPKKYAYLFWESPLIFAGEVVREGVEMGGTAKYQRALNSPIENFFETRRRRACRSPRAAGSASKEKPLRVGTRSTDRDARRQARSPANVYDGRAISSGRGCRRGQYNCSRNSILYGVAAPV